MRVGEDVVLVWPLSERGIVRYDPRVEIQHVARRSVRAVLGRRRGRGRLCTVGGAGRGRYRPCRRAPPVGWYSTSPP